MALLRYALAYVDRRTKSLQESHFSIRCAMRVLHCCMWCFEKIVKFISKNAYIMVAMKGKNFCRSTKAAFLLILTALSHVIISLHIIHVQRSYDTVGVTDAYACP